MIRTQAAHDPSQQPVGGQPTENSGELIALDSIRIDGGTQARVRLDDKAVREYADAYREGETFPPVVVYYDGTNYWLADGFHRHAAARQAELTEINADVRPGGLRDAILAAVGANALHGVRRNNRDKRKAVGILLVDPEWRGWSNYAIAEAARVSESLVRTMRAERDPDAFKRTRGHSNASNPAASALDASAVPSGPTTPAPQDGVVPTIRTGRDCRDYNVTGLQARTQPDPASDLDDEDDGEDWFPPADEPCPAKLDGRTCDDCPEDEPHHWEVYRPVGEPPIQVCKHCRTVGATLDDEPEPTGISSSRPQTNTDNTAVSAPDASAVPDGSSGSAPGPDPAHAAPAPLPPPAPSAPEFGGELPNDQRAPKDAYWTPDAHALACCRWMAEQGLFHGSGEVLEPAIGGGAWAKAVAEVWPEANVAGIDIDPDAPGLQLVERRQVGDFLSLRVDERDLILGNPPYDSDIIMQWLERSLERAAVVAYLLRETITGTRGRRRWWQEEHRPDWIAKLDTRPKWEGPGARSNSDFADSVLVVWVRRTRGLNTRTRFDWIEVPGGE